MKIIPFPTPENAPKSGRIDPVFRSKRQKKRADRMRSTADTIRAESKSHKACLDTPFSTKDYTTPEHHLSSYLKLHLNAYTDYQHIGCDIQKLLVCNSIMYLMQNDLRVSVPFVFRLPLSMRNLPAKEITSRLQKLIKMVLGESPLFWLTFEYGGCIGSNGNAGRHVNGEILIDRSKIGPLINALKSLYKTADELKCKRYAMRELRGKRLSEAYKHGIAYSVLNWPLYVTKERKRIVFEQGYMKRLPVDRLVYMSRPLSVVAKNYFDESVKK
ncbi:MAG: hypothetical protein RLZ92_1858 [Pseudomonadota bacterium]